MALNYEIFNITAGFNQSIFELNSQNGAIYLNDFQFSLMRRQNQQQRLQINIFVLVTSGESLSKLCRVRIRVQPPTLEDDLRMGGGGGELPQRFYSNTNNLLNFLNKGDEMSSHVVNLEENIGESSVVLNLRGYLRENFNLRKFYYFESVLDSLNFSLINGDESLLFRIDSITSNLLTNCQFNYETRRYYDLKIKIKQQLNEYEIDSVNDQIYTYYLDIRVNILNRVDELLTSKWPTYSILFNLEHLTESDEETITLFEIPVVDYESDNSNEELVSVLNHE